PGHSYARREIILVGVDQGIRQSGRAGGLDTDVAGRQQRADLRDAAVGDHDLARGDIENRVDAIDIGSRRVQLVAEAQVEREAWPDFVFPGERRVVGPAHLLVRGNSERAEAWCVWA